MNELTLGKEVTEYDRGLLRSTKQVANHSITDVFAFSCSVIIER